MDLTLKISKVPRLNSLGKRDQNWTWMETCCGRNESSFVEEGKEGMSEQGGGAEHPRSSFWIKVGKAGLQR